jgi:hypothetical protein
MYVEILCWEFSQSWKIMSYAFSISHVGELSGQNRCVSGTRNIESNTLLPVVFEHPGPSHGDSSKSSLYLSFCSCVKTWIRQWTNWRRREWRQPCPKVKTVPSGQVILMMMTISVVRICAFSSSWLVVKTAMISNKMFSNIQIAAIVLHSEMNMTWCRVDVMDDTSNAALDCHNVISCSFLNEHDEAPSHQDSTEEDWRAKIRILGDHLNFKSLKLWLPAMNYFNRCLVAFPESFIFILNFYNMTL